MQFTPTPGMQTLIAGLAVAMLELELDTCEDLHEVKLSGPTLQYETVEVVVIVVTGSTAVIWLQDVVRVTSVLGDDADGVGLVVDTLDEELVEMTEDAVGPAEESALTKPLTTQPRSKGPQSLFAAPADELAAADGGPPVDLTTAVCEELLDDGT